MRTLVFITAHYPFGTGETFIESEFPFLERNFDKVIIIAQDNLSPGTRKVHENIRVFRYNPSFTFSDFLSLPVLVVRHLRLIISLTSEEISFRNGLEKNPGIPRFFLLFKRILKAIHLKDFIISVLHSEKTDRDIIFYSYWLKSGAHAISLINYHSSIRISRAHGSDIYEEISEMKYLPLIKSTCARLDAIFFISENGRKYITGKLKTTDKKFMLSYLGINNVYSSKPEKEPDKYFIVSCSNMIPLKRIDMIIKSLGITRIGRKIIWMHFGDGPMYYELRILADEVFSKHEGIEYKFMGYYPNDKLLELYRTTYIDLFINASISEGLPVSMMEAQSAGIPIIATNVGGVGEIVIEGTGSLIDPDFKPEQLAGLIAHYSDLSESEIQKIRENAYNNWKSRFNVLTNYEQFIESLNAIFASPDNKKGSDEN